MKMKLLFKNGAVLFLKLVLATLLQVVFSVLLSVPIRSVLQNSDSYMFLYELVSGILGFLTEFFIVAFIFRLDKINDRRLQLKQALAPFCVAIPLHFAVAFWNGFYVYTAGYSTGIFGRFWWSAIIGETINEHRLVPRLYYSILFLLKSAFLILAAALGFRLGRRHIEKERKEIIGESASNDAKNTD